jgi:subtilisin family serine protease
MTPLDLVKLPKLMNLTSGRSEIAVGMVDGPIAISHADLTRSSVREVAGDTRAQCAQTNSAACVHGTFVAGILSAKRGSAAPAICPNCTLLVNPVFSEAATGSAEQPSSTTEELAAAILECIVAGARVVNLSLAVTRSSPKGERSLKLALDHAARHDVIIVAAAGNQGAVGGTVITSHPWVLAVAACDADGKPLNGSNLGPSIGLRGLRAPGEGVTSLGADGQSLTLGGTSVAAPFVTGAIALVWSQLPAATGAQIRLAFHHAHVRRRASVTPPLLDAWAAYQYANATRQRGGEP